MARLFSFFIASVLFFSACGTGGNIVRKANLAGEFVSYFNAKSCGVKQEFHSSRGNNLILEYSDIDTAGWDSDGIAMVANLVATLYAGKAGKEELKGYRSIIIRTNMSDGTKHENRVYLSETTEFLGYLKITDKIANLFSVADSAAISALSDPHYLPDSAAGSVYSLFRSVEPQLEKRTVAPKAKAISITGAKYFDDLEMVKTVYIENRGEHNISYTICIDRKTKKVVSIGFNIL